MGDNIIQSILARLAGFNISLVEMSKYIATWGENLLIKYNEIKAEVKEIKELNKNYENIILSQREQLKALHDIKKNNNSYELVMLSQQGQINELQKALTKMHEEVERIRHQNDDIIISLCARCQRVITEAEKCVSCDSIICDRCQATDATSVYCLSCSGLLDVNIEDYLQ